MSNKHSGLEADYQFFEGHRKEWSRDHEGQYAVLHEGKLVGFFDEYGTALRAGIAAFGAKIEFLVQQVSQEELVCVIY